MAVFERWGKIGSIADLIFLKTVLPNRLLSLLLDEIATLRPLHHNVKR